MTPSGSSTAFSGADRGAQGSALVMALLLAACLAFLGTTFLTISLTDRTIAANESRAARAFNVAEAGLVHAEAVLPGMDIDTLLSGGGVLLSGQAIGDGAYTVTVTNNIWPDYPTGTVPADGGGAMNDTDGVIVVTSVGTVGAATRTIRALYESSDSLFKYAVWSDGKLTFSSSGFTDSYDSGAGAYDPSTAGSEGHVFSNTEISLSGSSLIQGDAECAGGTAADPTHVTGSATANDPTQSTPLMTCPAGGYTPSVPAGSGVSYDPATGKLSVSGGNNLTLTVPPTEFYFSQVVLSGGSTLTFDNSGGQHVDLYVENKLDVSGGGLVNNASLPPLLAIWACGAGTSDFVLSGGSGAFFTVYAPNRKVNVTGSGDIWGAVISTQFTSSGGSRIHYDEALGGGTGVARVPRSWTELF